MSDPHDYTVGWICGIPTEYVAAQAFLDEKHEAPEDISPNDNNDYTLGKIGRHNVVIAVLPNGEYGLSSAASVARDMLHTFPNIKIGLMVGIGGGAPSLAHDIRLGDVVVGVPNSTKGGVVQYDYGNIIQGQEFPETGFLNQPPTLLRTAVGGLMAQYESEGHQIRETVNNAIAKKPRLKRKYTRPEASTDRLYQSQVVHPLNSETGCAEICGDDLSNLIKRPKRDEDEDDPAIHYGLIASANTLMRNASIRDKIARKGVLCFETEAAGLMNHFPCLVIRGICDYSDSHTNKEWQGYAAMTAAAYTKDLLYRITPKKVEAEAKISSILSGLYEVAQQHRDIAQNHCDIAEEHRDIIKEQIKTQEESEKEEKEQRCHQLFRLTSNNKDATYEWYKDRVEERAKDTCLWFLQHEHYKQWLKQEAGPLLVTADPGCGKSVLAKYLVDHGLPQFATICYFFFKDQDQNTSRQALCALLHQLFLQKPPLIRHAMPQFHTDGQNLINSTGSLWKILQNAVQDPEAGPIVIVLDALDECAESEFADLMRNVESQFRSDHSSSSDRGKLKYLLTCRPYPRITSEIHNKFKSFPNIRIPAEEESEVISQEINHVIAYRVNQLSLSPEIKNYLKDKLQETPHRTYLWVYLTLDQLKREDFKKTLRGAESAIKTLPRSVNEAYEQILNKSKESRMVRKALSIILAASRPLTLSEMNIAMNIDDTAQDGPTQTFQDLDLEDDSDFKLRLRSWCGLFISIHHGKVYFLHQTAREFLLAELATPTAIPSALPWHHSITTYQAHGVLAELCVLYLNLFNSTIKTDEKPSHSTNPDAFLDYAAKNWGTHFREAHIIDGAAIIPFTERICHPDSKSYTAWFENFWKTNYKYRETTGNFTNLIVASYFGHCAVVKLLIQKGADLEAKDTYYGQTPLLWAVRNGHEDVVTVLVKKGADIEAKDTKYGQTPLLWATMGVQEGVVRMLVERGADVKVKDTRDSGTPLSWAARKGHEGILKLLIEKGADLNAMDTESGYHRTPLSWAAMKGHESIVKLLVENGADISVKNDKDGENETPLSWAAKNGHEGVIKLLVEKGADVDGKNTEYLHSQTPLLQAVNKGHEGAVKLLAEKGADLEATDGKGRTPLIYAAMGGHESIVKLLVEKGSDIAARERSGRTALLWAAMRGHAGIVELLFEKGADIEVKDQHTRSALWWTTQKGLEEVAKLLVEKGADIETMDRACRTPLSLAAARGLERFVKQLIEKGADVEGGGGSWTPVLYAAANGQEGIVKLLVEKGADIETTDGAGRTPLSWATEKGYEGIVKLLIEKGADIKAVDSNGWTPLSWATEKGHEGIVKLLRSKSE